MGIKSEEVERQLDIKINNLKEDLHASIENLGAPYIEKIFAEDISFWDEDISRGEFSYYLGNQYFRTNSMRKAVIDIPTKNNSNLPEEWAVFAFDMAKAWGVLSHIFATNVGDALANMKLEVLKNTSGLSLITADQPAINLRGNKNGAESTEFEFYYPLSPQTAIIIYEDRKPLFAGNLCENDVAKLNDALADASLEQLYAKDNTALEKYVS